MRVKKHEKIICKYKKAPDTEKEVVRGGKVDIALVGATPGDMVCSRKPERPDLDDIWSQVANNINSSTALMTDNTVANIVLASPEIRKGVLSAFGGFLKRLSEISGEFYVKIASDGQV